MWNSTVALINGKHRYLTAENFGFKINANGQMLKQRQQWTLEAYSDRFEPLADASGGQAGTGSGEQPTLVQSVMSSLMMRNTVAGQNQSLTNGSHKLPQEPSQDSSAASSSSSSSTAGSFAAAAYLDDTESVAIKSHLNKYLAIDSFGNVTCDSDTKDDSTRFAISICSLSRPKPEADGQASQAEKLYWAIRHVVRGFYLGADEDGSLCCKSKEPKSRADLWLLHLLPARGATQFGLKSVSRNRFASLAEASQSTTEVRFSANVCWGPSVLFQLRYMDEGKYSIMTSQPNCYVTNEGKSVQIGPPESMSMPAECLFTLEYHAGFVAFRDSTCRYMTASGRDSLLSTRSPAVGRDELFQFECPPIQVAFKACFNNRWLSVKQGVDLMANQREPTIQHETFQMNYDAATRLWTIMSHDCNHWIVTQANGTISVASTRDSGACNPDDNATNQDQVAYNLNHSSPHNLRDRSQQSHLPLRAQFRLVWNYADSTCSLVYVEPDMVRPQRIAQHFDRLTDAQLDEFYLSSARPVVARKSGQLYLGASRASCEPARFTLKFQNRDTLNLRPTRANGFVGFKSEQNQKLEGNKTNPDTLVIEYNAIDTSSIGNQQTPAIISSKMNNQQQQQQSTKLDQTKVDALSYASDPVDANNNLELSSNSLEKGGVESESIASVASIINSFSKSMSMKQNDHHNQQQHQCYNIQPHSGHPKTTTTSYVTTSRDQSTSTASKVSSLASSFEQYNNNSKTQYHNQQPSQTNGVGLVKANMSSPLDVTQSQLQEPLSQLEQMSRFECCYLKSQLSGRYLVPTPEMDIIADTTNKACAQPWVLELRRDNAIAIKSHDYNAYMQLGPNGTVSLSRCEPSEATLWEF